MAIRLLGGLLLLCLASVISADQTIVVDGQDASIHYETGTGPANLTSWITQQRSPDTCDTPQKLTTRPGDYFNFTFTGTAVFVVGTTGKKRGILSFTFDGTTTPFDRTGSDLICDVVIFQKTGLPYQQHTVSGTFVSQQVNFASGELDGVLSVQRIRYNIPGGSSSNRGLVIGIIIGVIALVAILFFIGFRVFKKRIMMHRIRKRRTQQGFFDADDNARPKDDFTPALAATPFEWEGNQQHPQSSHNNNIRNPNAYGVPNSQYPEPGSPSFAAATAQPLLQSYSPSRTAHMSLPAGPSGPRTHSSSGSGGGGDPRQRESQLTGPSTTLVATNPDSNTIAGRAGEKAAMAGVYAMGPLAPTNSRGREPIQAGSPMGSGDPHMVDRIAQRLADIMSERVGVAGGQAPPDYEGLGLGPGPAAGASSSAGYSPTTSYPPPPLPSSNLSSSPPGHSPPPLAAPSSPPRPTRSSTRPLSPIHPPSQPTSPPRPSPPAIEGSSGNMTRFGPRPRPSSSRQAGSREKPQSRSPPNGPQD